MSHSRFMKPKYLPFMEDPEKLEQILKDASEIEKVVSAEFKPFSGRVSQFLQKLTKEGPSKVLVASSGFGSLINTGVTVFGNIAGKGGGHGILSPEQTGWGVALSAGLMVTAFALPPLAKALSKVVERFELKSYLENNKTISAKMAEAAAMLDPKMPQEVREMTLWSGRAQILRTLHHTDLGTNPTVNNLIVEDLEKQVHDGYHSLMDSKLNNKNADKGDHSPSM